MKHTMTKKHLMAFFAAGALILPTVALSVQAEEKNGIEFPQSAELVLEEDPDGTEIPAESSDSVSVEGSSAPTLDEEKASVSSISDNMVTDDIQISLEKSVLEEQPAEDTSPAISSDFFAVESSPALISNKEKNSVSLTSDQLITEDVQNSGMYEENAFINSDQSTGFISEQKSEKKAASPSLDIQTEVKRVELYTIQNVLNTPDLPGGYHTSYSLGDYDSISIENGWTISIDDNKIVRPYENSYSWGDANYISKSFGETEVTAYKDDTPYRFIFDVRDYMDVFDEKLVSLSVDLYALDEAYKDKLSIPLNRPTSFTIPETTQTFLLSGDSVTIDNNGTITPYSRTWYWSNGIGSTSPFDTENQTTTIRYTFDESIVGAIQNNIVNFYKVDVKDYSDVWYDEQLEQIIKVNTTPSTTNLEKLDLAAKTAASFDYSVYYSDGKSMMVFGGGDCWASTYLISDILTKMGIPCQARIANYEPGSGSGHRNAIAKVDGKYYILEAGYVQTGPRYYYVAERNSGPYSIMTNYDSPDECTFYAYDGFAGDEGFIEGNLIIPEYIDGLKVTAIDSAMRNRSDIITVTIPRSVTNIDIAALTNSNIRAIYVNSQNPFYKSVDGAILSKDGTILYRVPVNPDKDAYRVPDGVVCLDVSALLESQYSTIYIPSSVKSVLTEALGFISFYPEDSTKPVIVFEGDMPEFPDIGAFYYSDAIVRYDKNNSTWNPSLIPMGDYDSVEFQAVNLSRWVLDNGDWYFYDKRGDLLKNQWIGKYYVKADGKMAVSEFIDDDTYVDQDGLRVPGKMKPRWMTDRNGSWYRLEDGSYVANRWAQIDGNWYYFNDGGYMVTNKWIQGHYYVKSDGAMAVNEWIDNLYYVNKEGYWIPSRWLLDSIGWWYRHGDGSYTMNDWELIENQWYYFNSKGYMLSNRWIDGIYYVKDNGTMARSEWVDNNQYYVGADGVWVRPVWIQDSTGWWYRHIDGSYTRSGWEQIEGKWYYFNAQGYRLSNCWISGIYYLKADGSRAVNEWVEDGLYYCGSDGKWVEGKPKPKAQWITDSHGKWYRRSDGTYPKDEWEKIGDKWYYFDNQGYLLTSQWIDGMYVKEDGSRAMNEWVNGWYVDENGRLSGFISRF